MTAQTVWLRCPTDSVEWAADALDPAGCWLCGGEGVRPVGVSGLPLSGFYGVRGCVIADLLGAA